MPHSLQLSQLWKLNRQQPWDEGSFSVADPVDPRLARQAEGSGWTATSGLVSGSSLQPDEMLK